MDILGTLSGLVQESGFAGFLAAGGWKNLIMIAVACVLLYLGIGKKFEPLLMVGIAFGVLLTNIPGAGLYHMGMWDSYVYGCPYDAANDYALYNTAEERAYNEMELNYYIAARVCGHTTAQIEEYFEKQADALGGRMAQARKRFDYAGVKRTYEECLPFRFLNQG